LNILVTGGTGYIGSHTAVELINTGHNVYLIDDLSNSNADVVDAIAKITGKRPFFLKLNIRNQNKLFAFFEENKVDAIIHFAATILVDESVEKPLDYYYNNLVCLINVLQIARKLGITNLVFSSSCSVYGEPDILPATENSPIKKAESPYANTKQIGEQIIQDAVNSFPHQIPVEGKELKKQLNAISLRYFNPIGAHESALIGEEPHGKPSHLVSVITRTVSSKEGVVKVFGNDYNTPDGTCIRDYIHVVDVAKAHVKAVERLLNKKNKSHYEVYNIGTGKGQSVMEAIQTFEKVTGTKCPYQIVPRRAGDVEKVYADTSLANKELKWKAEKSFDEAILSAWNWELQLVKKFRK
jgi:UDP-glucose 4-epimerase